MLSKRLISVFAGITFSLLLSLPSVGLAQNDVIPTCKRLKRELTQWKITPMKPAVPGKPSMKESHQFFLDWFVNVLNFEEPKKIGIAWLVANVDFSVDYTQVVFAARMPPLTTNQDENRDFQAFHLDLLTGDLKVLFLTADGKRPCATTQVPKISTDGQWVVGGAVWHEPDFGGSKTVEKTWIQNLKTNQVQVLNPYGRIYNAAFAPDGRTLFTYHSPGVNDLFLARTINMDKFILREDGTWSNENIQRHPIMANSCGFGLSMTTSKVISVKGEVICGSPEVFDHENPSAGSVNVESPLDFGHFNLGFKWFPGTALAGGSVHRDNKFQGLYLFDVDSHKWLQIPITPGEDYTVEWYGTKDGKHIVFGSGPDIKAYNMETGDITLIF